MAAERRDRRDEILTAAREIAEREGVSALTVRGVSAAAGVGVGTLRHYFPTQRALVDAVVAGMVGGMLDESVVLDRACSPGDRLAHAVLQFLPEELAAAEQLDAWFAFYVSALSSGSSEHTRGVLEAAVAASHAQMRRWLAQLADEGHIDPDRVPDIATGLIALVNGLVLEALTPGSPATIAQGRRIAETAARAVVGERFS